MADRVRLERGAQAPAAARTAITGLLAGQVDATLLDDLRLLVSELVTNAVRHPHSQGHIEMTVGLAGARVRVEVSDPGNGFAKPAVSQPPPDAIGGRGLLIVDRVASRWGVTNGKPTRVWFELDAG